MAEAANIKSVLSNIHGYPDGAWIYLPSDSGWTLGSMAMVLKSEEVPPEFEDREDAGVPKIATQNKLMQALSVAETKLVIYNAKSQDSKATIEQLFKAFLHYYDYDSYIQLTSGEINRNVL